MGGLREFLLRRRRRERHFTEVCSVHGRHFTSYRTRSYYNIIHVALYMCATGGPFDATVVFSVNFRVFFFFFYSFSF